MLTCIGKQHVPLGCLKSHKRFVNQFCGMLPICYFLVLSVKRKGDAVLDDIHGNMLYFILLGICLVFLS